MRDGLKTTIKTTMGVRREQQTRFFHLVANSCKTARQILRLRVGEQEYVGTQAIGQAIASHFCAFTKRGKKKLVEMGVGGQEW